MLLPKYFLQFFFLVFKIAPLESVKKTVILSKVLTVFILHNPFYTVHLISQYIRYNKIRFTIFLLKKFKNLNLKITDFNKIKPTKYRDLKHTSELQHLPNKVRSSEVGYYEYRKASNINYTYFSTLTFITDDQR